MSYYYDRIAPIYDATRPLPPFVAEQVTDCILKLVSATPETTFLEPGIGTGRSAFSMIKRGYSYIGVDVSNEMMEELRRKLQNIPNRLSLIQTDATSLPFKDNTFDVAIAVHVLHLIPNWRQAVAEIRRVLKPDGFFLYCNNMLTPHQREFEQQWRTILTQYLSGFQLSFTKTWEGDEGLIQALKSQGATLETVNAARWRVEQTVGELLDIYQMRPFGICWEIPDDIFALAMREFREWCQQHYQSEAVVLASDATFDITVINWVSQS